MHDRPDRDGTAIGGTGRSGRREGVDAFARRHGLRSPLRKLSCIKQALLTPAHLRRNETYRQVGAGFGVSEATA
ncbi:helix-turn-helix domain-containing protein [Streptomyces sp. PTD9-10]|uniref:helix-turn-helix domain-containing protein n=1 Tax=Streptomyces sp. PTD9-10 TaxID=3120151 RepID=UPI003FCC4176